MAEKTHTIAVVGGGIAGLTLTLGLLHQKVPVTLYESASSFGEIGAGVAFGPNASRAMELIDPKIRQGFENRKTQNLWESKKSRWFDFRYGVGKKIGEGPEERVGELIVSLDTPPGRGTVHRAHFLDEMVALLPDGISRFGKRLVDLTDEGPEKGVVLRFADGTEARHIAVIGTDGIKSRTRELLLGEGHPAAKAFFSGKYAYRALIPMQKASELLGEELANNSQMYFGNHGHVLTFPIERGKTMNVVAFRSREKWENPEWVITVDKQTMQNDFKGWSQHVQNIIANVEKPNIWALFMHPPAPYYYKGRVCILGDAAHASTPHCGAGAGMAIEDSYVLSGLIGQETIDGDLEAAFKAYDAVRRERSQKLVVESKRQAEIYEFEVPEIGEDKESVAAIMRTRMSWIWDEDLPAEARLASELLQKFKAESGTARL
ncbi:mannitol 1-phosphate dehydrogenase [Rhizodiscina lignyota]|uniref:Mannitol 1-phosphate dehydrogenase n=1 Tax=Rhizodiscina lignyota TaxID=1504668 RepID=A0A9P4ICW5_9PEZI|nr:mannitol 1-phosphate dehydrogenase [Rhizodiscina lignyota]